MRLIGPALVVVLLRLPGLDAVLAALTSTSCSCWRSRGPITIAGLGVHELFFALTFPQLGSSAEAGVIFGLGVSLVIHVPATALGFVSWQIAPPPLGDSAR